MKALLFPVGILTLIALVCGGCSSAPTTAKVPNGTGNGSLAVSVTGVGKPVIVLQSGLGDGKSSWGSTLGELAKRNQVFAYDRPGYGGSDRATGLRSPASIATELRAALKSAGLNPPYVLVGHSIGGLYQYAYAKLYPDEVAGLVLVDPTHPNHWERMQADAPGSAQLIKGLRLVAFGPTQRAEFDDQAAEMEKIDSGAPLQVPVILLTRTRYGLAESGDFKAMVESLQEDWRRLLGPKCELRAVEGAGHYIHQDKPAEFVSAVRDLCSRIESQARPPASVALK